MTRGKSADGQYMVLKFWSYETFDKDAVNQMKVGDVLLLRGEPRRIDALKRSENSLGETTCADINGDMADYSLMIYVLISEIWFRGQDHGSRSREKTSPALRR